MLRQNLGAAEEQDSAGADSPGHTGKHIAFELAGKIDCDIAAEYDIKTPQHREAIEYGFWPVEQAVHHTRILFRFPVRISSKNLAKTVADKMVKG